MLERRVVRGRSTDPLDRLPPNETGLEVQPTRFTSAMWAVILFISSESTFFAAVFFTLTGFHGAHVTGGVLFNTICFYRTLKGQFTARRHLAVEAASIYWHFVDVVWIGLFTTIYIVG